MATCINTSGRWLWRKGTCIDTILDDGYGGLLPASMLVEAGYGGWLWRKSTCINTIVDDGYGGMLPESILVEDGYGGWLPVSILVDNGYLYQY